MNENIVIKGYKVFNNQWQCRDKQYACPGKFEEDVNLRVCDRGMHFCKNLTSCFNYYKFNPSNKVAEVIAYGAIVENGDKCCTDKLEIVREISWEEVLRLCNSGDYNSGNCNSGYRNSGYRNSGNYNSGDYNSGDYNSGYRNSGNCNSGDYNSGDYNSGDYNSGYRNSGNCNSGDYNSGDYNSGDYNSGYRNSGDYNSGDYNSGDYNSGDYNSGYRNSGDYNSGDYNSGDYNSGDYSTGCFNTVGQKIYMFNKISSWTYSDWLTSRARSVLLNMPFDEIKWIASTDMTDEEKINHPSHETTGGFLKSVTGKDRQKWWAELSEDYKATVESLPNFNASIFESITGIHVE